MIDQEFVEKVAESLDQLGYTLESAQQSDVIDDLTNADNNIILPGTENDSQGNILRFVNLKIVAVKNYLSSAVTAIQTTWNGWFGTSDSTGVQGDWKTLRADVVDKTGAANTATANANNAADRVDTVIAMANQDHTRAESDHNTASTDHGTATDDHTQAGSDHTQATNDSIRAGTDHQTATSDHTQAGQDHTRAEQDHTTAGDDHTQAGTDHQTATQDHSTASTDHSTATDDHTQAGADHDASVLATNAANTQANRAKGYNDHPWEIGNDGYIYVWDESTQTMVKTNKMIIDFDDLTPAQRQQMIDDFYATLVFATPAECRAIVTGYHG